MRLRWNLVYLKRLARTPSVQTSYERQLELSITFAADQFDAQLAEYPCRPRWC